MMINQNILVTQKDKEQNLAKFISRCYFFFNLKKNLTYLKLFNCNLASLQKKNYKKSFERIKKHIFSFTYLKY